jgi:hypothetical protein
MQELKYQRQYIEGQGSRVADDGVVRSQSINANRIAMARRLEVPVFKLMKQQLQRKLGNPTTENLRGEPWKVVWANSHLYELQYIRRPQTANVEGQHSPDFILEVDGKPRLAVEAKNWSLTSKWSRTSARKQIVDRFAWLPPSCECVVLASHLQANGPAETMEIRKMLMTHNIQICLLGHPVGYPPLTGRRAYAILAPMVSEWLAFIPERTKRSRLAKGQRRIAQYVEFQRRAPREGLRANQTDIIMRND